MTQQRVPAPGTTCPSCNAGLDCLVIGGVGDWRTKCVCVACMKVWSMPTNAIITLVACQYGITEAQAREADTKSQHEFESICLGGEPYDDLPQSLNTARWHARRLLATRQS